jgi:hypothetical protein
MADEINPMRVWDASEYLVKNSDAYRRAGVHLCSDWDVTDKVDFDELFTIAPANEGRSVCDCRLIACGRGRGRGVEFVIKILLNAIKKTRPEIF